jgi:DNA-binding response OmpR family regulator
MVHAIRALGTVPRCPVIFLTARTDAEDIIAGIQAGARHYLAKPIDLDDLERRVRRALGG